MCHDPDFAFIFEYFANQLLGKRLLGVFGVLLVLLLVFGEYGGISVVAASRTALAATPAPAPHSLLLLSLALLLCLARFGQGGNFLAPIDFSSCFAALYFGLDYFTST